MVTAVLNHSTVYHEQDVTFNTSAGFFTKLPGGIDNLGTESVIRTSGLKAQIILNLDSTIVNDVIVGASIKDPNTNNIYPLYRKLFIISN